MPRLARPGAPRRRPRARARSSGRWPPASSLYAIQASYSADFGHALENVVFFYVPFALLFALWPAWRGRRSWRASASACSSSSRWPSSGVGFVEYATRHLFLNPKVIASNQLEDYFRVNSLFFDPNIYGRFLAIVMLLLAAWLLWARRQRDVVAGALLLAVLWGGLVLTFSQSSFTALLVGLAMLGGDALERALGARSCRRGALVVGVVFVALAPGAVHLDLGNSKSADKATSGRYDLIKGGLKLFERARRSSARARARSRASTAAPSTSRPSARRRPRTRSRSRWPPSRG